jgi:hypothetical protein
LTQLRVGPPRVDRFDILRDEALVSAFLHDRPGGEPVIRQAPRGVDHAGAVHLSLEHGATPMQRQAAQVETVAVQAVEGHEDGRRARLVGGSIEQVELAHEVLVEHAHLAIENQRRCFEHRDRSGELAETLRVVDAVAADEAHGATILVDDHAPACVQTR